MYGHTLPIHTLSVLSNPSIALKCYLFSFRACMVQSRSDTVRKNVSTEPLEIQGLMYQKMTSQNRLTGHFTIMKASDDRSPPHPSGPISGIRLNIPVFHHHIRKSLPCIQYLPLLHLMLQN